MMAKQYLAQAAKGGNVQAKDLLKKMKEFSGQCALISVVSHSGWMSVFIRLFSIVSRTEQISRPDRLAICSPLPGLESSTSGMRQSPETNREKNVAGSPEGVIETTWRKKRDNGSRQAACIVGACTDQPVAGGSMGSVTQSGRIGKRNIMYVIFTGFRCFRFWYLHFPSFLSDILKTQAKQTNRAAPILSRFAPVWHMSGFAVTKAVHPENMTTNQHFTGLAGRNPYALL